MGSLFKVPKYTPPPEQAQTDKLLDQRNERAEANEKKEARKLAAKKRARRQGGRLLYSQDRAVPQLGVGTTLTEQGMVRNPYNDERMA